MRGRLTRINAVCHSVLYGGSVKADSVAEIVGQPDVDGGLVGGASLDGEAFAKLCANAAGGPF